MSVDILMITYDRPDYTQLSLSALLDTCDETMNVWLWHNGEDEATREVTESFVRHPRVTDYHHSPVNQGLTAPTNRLWRRSTADYVSKIDDDCIVSPDWAETLGRAHADDDRLGVIGSWRFYDEDYVPELVAKKLTTVSGGHQIMTNPWVQGSGYLLRRRCIEEIGPLADGESFTAWCIRLAARGWINGWYFPFIHEEHLDDPRSPHTALESDEDLQRRLPLSAANRGITTLAAWEQRMRESALELQRGSSDPDDYMGMRARLRTLSWRLGRRWIE